MSPTLLRHYALASPHPRCHSIVPSLPFSRHTHLPLLSSTALTVQDVDVCAVVMSSKSAVAIEVELQATDLRVRALGAGAHDWFTAAPWEVSNGTLLRDLLHMDDASVLDKIKYTLSQGSTKSKNGAAGKLQLNVKLAHYKRIKYLPQHGRRTEHRSVQIVEYVASKLQLVVFPDRNKPGSSVDKERSNAAQPAQKCLSRALVFFNLPSTWQWVADSEPALVMQASDAVQCPAESRGRFVDMTVDAARVSTLEHIVGPAHEYMGVFVVDRKASVGLEGLDAFPAKSLKSLEGIKRLLSDPKSLLDDTDKAMMESVVASFGKGKAGEDSVAKLVTDCMELHTGIATHDESDCLAVSYRIKLPQALGGYESAWKSLYSYNLNTNVVRFLVLPGHTYAVDTRSVNIGGN